MRLLFDQNLSSTLVSKLEDIYPGSVHVRNLGMLEADDSAIRIHAAEHDFVVVSKDSDFHQMSLLHGHPPKTVWLRVGNAPTTIEKLLRAHHSTLLRFHKDPDTAFLALA